MKSKWYTAVQFGGDQSVLCRLADQMENTTVGGQILGYFSDYTGVVFWTIIDGTNYMVVGTVPPSGTAPQAMKRVAVSPVPWALGST